MGSELPECTNFTQPSLLKFGVPADTSQAVNPATVWWEGCGELQETGTLEENVVGKLARLLAAMQPHPPRRVMKRIKVLREPSVQVKRI
ncbi:MAG TPA: hypothetical protein VNF75_08140 [Candidatus Dormibacteraeota bacterium]|nr:hypothetical protein [Candidatus Dormibacteraeota bacterium]